MENKIQTALVSAMKGKNQHNLIALREIKTAITTFKTSSNFKGEITDNDIVSIIQKLVKQHQETLDAVTNANRTDMIEQEKNVINCMSEFLPKMLSNDEVQIIIDKFVGDNNLSGMKDMGKIMNHLKETIPNQYDPKFVSTYAKSKLA